MEMFFGAFASLTTTGKATALVKDQQTSIFVEHAYFFHPTILVS
jgi:hypothetical protein